MHDVWMMFEWYVNHFWMVSQWCPNHVWMMSKRCFRTVSMIVLPFWICCHFCVVYIDIHLSQMLCVCIGMLFSIKFVFIAVCLFFYIRNLCAQSFICHIFLLSLVLAFLLRSQRCRIIIIPLWFIIDCPLGTWWYVVCCGLATASQGILNGFAVTQ